MTLARLLMLSFVVFAIGLFGVLARRHVIAVMLSIELMFNSINLAILSVAWAHGWLNGVLLVLFGIAVTVAEVAVGLSLFLLAERVRRTTRVDDLSMLKG
ncbi:MAG: NADH-quinone oxidoreductase subunit NuoK [Acidobacteriota bacterium]